MPAPKALPKEVRIIGGQWKRTKLPVADKPGLRPTPDRVRETLFNWLGQDLTGWRCVDAFAGTGALGLEAASRGAAQVLLVEQDPGLVSQLRALQLKLAAHTVSVQRANGLSVLKQLAPASMELIRRSTPSCMTRR
jgi:16S rRNA (guanine966-N2)-methyltransferase